VPGTGVVLDFGVGVFRGRGVTVGGAGVSSGFGVVNFSGFGVADGFSGFGVVSGLGTRIRLGVGLGLTVAEGSGVPASRRLERCDAGVGVAVIGVVTGAGVAGSLCRCEPNSQSKKDRRRGFGVGVGAVSALGRGAGVAAGSPDLAPGLPAGFSPLDSEGVLWSVDSLAVAEVASFPWAGDTSWAKTSAAPALTAIAAVRTERDFGMVGKWKAEELAVSGAICRA